MKTDSSKSPAQAEVVQGQALQLGEDSGIRTLGGRGWEHLGPADSWPLGKRRSEKAEEALCGGESTRIRPAAWVRGPPWKWMLCISGRDWPQPLFV